MVASDRGAVNGSLVHKLSVDKRHKVCAYGGGRGGDEVAAS